MHACRERTIYASFSQCRSHRHLAVEDNVMSGYRIKAFLGTADPYLSLEQYSCRALMITSCRFFMKRTEKLQGERPADEIWH